MADMTDEELIAYVKRVTDNIEAAYRALRASASTLTALLAIGKATCKEIQNYNLLASAVANTQEGLLIAVKNSGAKNLPDLPDHAPVTLFAWKNVPAEQMLDVDCNQLSDAGDRFVSSADIKILMNNPEAYKVLDKAPSLNQLTAELSGSQLGLPAAVFWLVGLLIIGSTIVAYSVFQWLREKAIPEETTKQARILAELGTATMKNRLDCYTQCLNAGGSADSCMTGCEKLIPEPDIHLPDYGKGGWPFGIFSTLVIVGGIAGFGVWAYRRKLHHRFLRNRDAAMEAEVEQGIPAPAPAMSGARAYRGRLVRGVPRGAKYAGSAGSR